MKAISMTMWRNLCLTILSVLLFAAHSFAAPPVQQDRAGVAIRGYDPVAYFVQGKAIPGSQNYPFEWQGATWYFANEGHRRLFAEAPEKYAPQYGGYCAYAVSKNSLAPVDPKAWTVHDGKLYLNYSARVRTKWEKDLLGNIAKGDDHWPAVLQK